MFYRKTEGEEQTRRAAMSLDSKFYSQGWSWPDSLPSELLGGFPKPKTDCTG